MLQAKARLNYCFFFKIALLWQLRFISKSEKEPNSYGNLQHCGRKPRCADVEIIALSLFQEFLSIDSECLFFDTLQSILPDLAIRVGSRRNYNARRHHLVYLIEKIRARIVKSISDDVSGTIRLIDSMPMLM